MLALWLHLFRARVPDVVCLRPGLGLEGCNHTFLVSPWYFCAEAGTHAAMKEGMGEEGEWLRQ